MIQRGHSLLSGSKIRSLLLGTAAIVLTASPIAAAFLAEQAEEARLWNVFQAATGHRDAFTVRNKDGVVTTRPLRIVRLPSGSALLTEETIEDGAHAQEGAIGVHYFDESSGKSVVTGRWPRAVTGWDWGKPPLWKLTQKFTSNPAIYAWGDFMAQGIVVQGATITELTPQGPSTSDLIGTGYDDRNGRLGDEDPICAVRGRIAKVRQDRFFTVAVSGSVETTDRYVKKEGRFVPVQRIKWDIPCGYRDDGS